MSATARKRVVLLGATGSIGENTLHVLRANPGALELFGIASHSRTEALAAIAREFGVRHVGIADADAARAAVARGLFAPGTTIYAGEDGLGELAARPECDLVLSAIVGTGGLKPTLTAIRAGKDIALASKEILVLAGAFVTAAVRAAGGRLLPVDSEHNAIFQCLHGNDRTEVARILLTASGGAFRDRPLEELGRVTVAEALRHPNWAMGPKVTVDSATMANKGLEMIEARWLFDLAPAQVEVVIHPQSIVHSMVEFVDGSVLAQLSPPSMTFAIQHALLFPRRFGGVHPAVDFKRPLQLDFFPPDENRFPALRSARQALVAGGVAPAIFNAANEVAVEAFLQGRLPFLGIADLIARALDSFENFEPASLEAVLEVDRLARQAAQSFLGR